METFGSLIRKSRISKGMSVKELIKRLDDSISPAYVTMIETKGEIPSPLLILKLCNPLGLDAETLLTVAKKEKLEEYKDMLDIKYNIARLELKSEEEIEHEEQIQCMRITDTPPYTVHRRTN